MELGLNRATFRRLVWLQLILLIAVLPIAAFEAMDPRHSRFDLVFAASVEQVFGPGSAIGGKFWIVTGPVVIGFMASLAGLLRFARWARPGYLATTVLLCLLSVIGNYPVAYASWTTTSFEIIGDMATGATLLLAYGRGAGQDWFSAAPPAQQR